MTSSVADPWVVPIRPEGRPAAGRAVLTLLVAVCGSVIWAVRQPDPTLAVGSVVMAALWLATWKRMLSGRWWGVLALGLPAAIAGAAAGHVGRGTVLVVLWSVCVVDLALSGSSPGRGRAGHRPFPLAVAPVMAAQVSTAEFGAGPPAVLFVGVGAITLVVSQALPSAAEALAGTVGAGVRAMSDALSVAIVTLVAVPTLYLPTAAARWLRLQPLGAAIGDGWTRSTPRRSSLDEATHMFAPTDPAVRARRLRASAVVVGIALMVIVPLNDHHTDVTPVAAAATPAGSSVSHRRTTARTALRLDEPLDRYSSRRAFAGVRFADDLQQEQDRFLSTSLVFDASSGYTNGDFDGRFTTTANGERRTLGPPACSTCADAAVWLVGGSAAFGIGQRDEHTIASSLVRAASADGVSLSVRNLAVPGWVVAQGSAAVLARLSHGEPPPDLIVFYDGYNDAYAAAVAAWVGDATLDAFGRVSASDQARFRVAARAGRGAFADMIARAGGARAVGSAAAKNYLRSRDALVEELDEAGVEAAFMLQTDAFVTRSHESDAIAHEPAFVDAVDRRAWTLVLETMESTVRRAGVVDFRHVAAETDDAVFIDSVHTNEKGAAMVANAMYSDLRPLLRARLRGDERPR